ncbi:MAG: hypothetical protein ABI039_06565 [Vicinamibacterales bacterium]
MATAFVFGQAATPAPIPTPALDSVIAALRANPLVAISDPRFAGIVVEIGNSRYQSIVDDYVTGPLHFQRRQMASNFFMDDWRTQTIEKLCPTPFRGRRLQPA